MQKKMFIGHNDYYLGIIYYAYINKSTTINNFTKYEAFGERRKIPNRDIEKIFDLWNCSMSVQVWCIEDYQINYVAYYYLLSNMQPTRYCVFINDRMRNANNNNIIMFMEYINNIILNCASSRL